jgi:hypothetical protein
VFEVVRGDGSTPAIDPGDPTHSRVLIEVAVPSDATDIAVMDGTGRRTAFQPGSDGLVSVLLPCSMLTRGVSHVIDHHWQGQLLRRDLSIELPHSKQGPSRKVR